MFRFYRPMINWMHMKSKEFGDTHYSCFKIEQDCHCEEDDSPTRPSIVSRGTRTVLSVRLLAHSGSPRATPSRLQNGGQKELSEGKSHDPISLFKLQSSLFLHWLFWKPTRKPMLLSREPGVLRLRLAERRGGPPLLQEPPRRTRFEPEAGPVGSTTGLPVG